MKIHPAFRTSLLALALTLGACAHSQVGQKQGLDSYALEKVPTWAADFTSDDLYLDIDRLMKGESLTRREAIEAQAFYRSALTRDPKQGRSAVLADALKRVRAGETVSGWVPPRLESPADFILVVDIDETLLQQWYSGANGFYDRNDALPDGTGYQGVYSGSFIKYAPGAEAFLRSMRKNPHCKSIVLFTGKVASAARDIVSRWSARDVIDGVFARDHLVVSASIATGSKDLRIFDPELKRVLLLDDSPGRVIQPRVLRAHPKFDADRYAKAIETKDVETRRHYETLFEPVKREIAESVSAAKRLGIPFSQAFLPYSYSGETVYRALRSRLGSETKARDALRRHPEWMSATFFIPKREKN